MGHIVVSVSELVEHLIATLFDLVFSIVSRALDSSLCQNHLSAIGFHSLYSFSSRIFWHHQFNLQIKDTSDHRQSNACIPTCWFN